MIFSFQPILIKQFCHIVIQGMTNNLCCLKQINNRMFRLPINSQEVNDNGKYIMCPVTHKSKLVMAII